MTQPMFRDWRGQRERVERDQLVSRAWAIGLLLALAVIVMLIGATRAHAQIAPQTQAVGHQALGVAVGASGVITAIDLSAAGGVSYCTGTVEGAGVRYWMDGGVPTTTQGHLASAGGQIVLPSRMTAAGFVFTPVAGPGSTVQVSCFKGGAPFVMVSTFDTSQAAAGVNTASAGSALPLPQCNAVRLTNCQK